MTGNTKKMELIRNIGRPVLIFLAYFLFGSLFLFNHSGGTDIAFIGFVVFSAFLHLVILLSIIVKSIIKKDRKAPFIDLVIVLLLLFLFILLSNRYLDFMWWLTNRK